MVMTSLGKAAGRYRKTGIEIISCENAIRHVPSLERIMMET
jgi:hypothetical protein